MFPGYFDDNKHLLLLGSKSPRRRNLLREVGLKYEVLPVVEVDESFPPALEHLEVPVFLSKIKADAYKQYLRKDAILITADTIVSLNNEILGKPKDLADAKLILRKLSGNCHQVISGVCLTSLTKQKWFHAVTNVYFKQLTENEIEYYIEKYKPLDKAGGYGIQEWIGYIGVEKIEGSFYNVMGLPVQKLYTELLNF